MARLNLSARMKFSKGERKKKSNKNKIKKQISLKHFLGPYSKFIFHDYKINVNSSQEL